MDKNNSMEDRESGGHTNKVRLCYSNKISSHYVNFLIPVAVSLQCFLHCGKWVLWEVFLLWHEVHLVVVSEEKAGILWGQGHDNLSHILLFLLLHTNPGSLDCRPVSGEVQDDRLHLLPLHPGSHSQDNRCCPQYRSGPLVSTREREWYITLMMMPGTLLL